MGSKIAKVVLHFVSCCRHFVPSFPRKFAPAGHEQKPVKIRFRARFKKKIRFKIRFIQSKDLVYKVRGSKRVYSIK